MVVFCEQTVLVKLGIIEVEKTFLKKIQSSLEEIIKDINKPLAVFDADGTLWPSDVGENFFNYQVKKGLLKDKTSDPPAEFNRIREQKGRKAALLWLAQIQSGISLETLNQWILDFLRENPFKVFLFQKHLIEWLISKNVHVFVVSSSLKWVLDQALQKYNIPKENIIGVQTLVQQGFITSQAVLPPPIHKEKVQAFQEKSKGACPIFVSGNTLSDQALLELSSQIKLVVSTAQLGERTYDSERELLKIAQKRNWFYLDGMPELS